MVAVYFEKQMGASHTGLNNIFGVFACLFQSHMTNVILSLLPMKNLYSECNNET